MNRAIEKAARKAPRIINPPLNIRCSVCFNLYSSLKQKIGKTETSAFQQSKLLVIISHGIDEI
jgi:hypothetical protein